MVGEHIRALKQGRWNHAIDCGDETVIHLAEEGSRPPSIRRSYRPEFVSGADVVEVVRHRQRTFPAGEVVARAYSRIADPVLAAMFPTSESFAHWCATGRPSPEALPERAAASEPPAAKVRGRGRVARPSAPGKAAGARRRPRAARRPRRASQAAKAKAPRTTGRRKPGRRRGPPRTRR